MITYTRSGMKTGRDYKNVERFHTEALHIFHITLPLPTQTAAIFRLL